MKSILALILSISTVSAIKGIDFQGAATKDTYQCLKDNGYNFAVLRANLANSSINPTLISNIQQAAEAGWDPTNVQLYLIPCLPLTAAKQVSDLFTALKNTNTGDITSKFSRIWINVETNPVAACSWSTTPVNNCNFLLNLIAEITSQAGGHRVGIFSSPFMWSRFMGPTLC